MFEFSQKCCRGGPTPDLDGPWCALTRSLSAAAVSLVYTGRLQTCDPKGMQTGSAG